MRHWSLIGIRNLRVKPGRAAGAVLAISLGVGIIVWISSTYESFLTSIRDQVEAWVGRSHISVEASYLGLIDETLVAEIGALDNIDAVCPKARFSLFAGGNAASTAEEEFLPVNVVGIDPSCHYGLRTYRALEQRLTFSRAPVYGRLLGAEDGKGCMIEDALALELGLDVGQTIEIASEPGGNPEPFTIVGRYLQRRVAKFQKPSVVVLLAQAQQLSELPGKVSVIDVVLDDHSIAATHTAAQRIRALVEDKGENYPVRTAEARMRQLNEAHDQAQFIMSLICGVALLTSFFIVVTTMSMGMIERLTQMGMMRCVGATRMQLAIIALCEILPIGVVGVAAGIPIGLGLTHLGVQMMPEYIQGMVISIWGLWAACVGGLLTTLVSGLVPAFQAAFISPLAATHAQATGPRTNTHWFAALLGIVLISTHELGIYTIPGHWWFGRTLSGLSILALILGYTLLAPLLVRLLGHPLSAITGRFLKIRKQLLQGQIVSSPWRSGMICCGFMVALALVVAVGVHTDSVTAGWSFPSDIPESFVWMGYPISMDKIEPVRAVRGAREVIGVTNFMCYIEAPQRSGAARSHFPLSTFVAVDAPQFLEHTRLEFLEGNPEQARKKMIHGGAIIVPDDAARLLGLHAGDRVPIRRGIWTHTLEVAGIVRSPALDVAAFYFDAERQLLQASATSIIGSLADARDHFDVDHLSLFLINMELPEATPAVPEFFEVRHPPRKITHEYMAKLLFTWQPRLERYSDVIEQLKPKVRNWNEATGTWVAEGRHRDPPQTPDELVPFTRALRRVVRHHWYELTPPQRWQRFGEQIILQEVKMVVDRPNAITGSIRQIKEDIDQELQNALRIITTIPLIGLIVAAIGAGNLMMANVAVRLRHIAVIRAVGATRGQVIRLVLAEALVLGALGSGLGLTLGLHAAKTINVTTMKVWGYLPTWSIPWDIVAGSVLFTVAMCMIAGIVPARYAARSNIVAAMAAK